MKKIILGGSPADMESAVNIAGGRASVDESRCIKCGYCVAACPEFCIRMI